MAIGIWFCIGCAVLALLASEPSGGESWDGARVDLAWKVVSHRAAQDSFGKRVAERFFALEVHIGNNSGHDLLLSGFYFRPPRTVHRQALETNDPYSIVRGVLEREQQVGDRALMMHAVRSIGPLLSLGGALISGGTVTLAKYGASVGIFSNGIEKGLDNAYPDQTLRRINRLEENSFHDHVVLRRNEPRRLVVFLARETVQCPPALAKAKKGAAASDPCTGLLPWSREFSPRQVKERIGTLELHGHALAYTRRIRVEAEKEVQ